MEIVNDYDSIVRKGEPKISISIDEYKALLKPAKARLKVVENRYEKYLGIHESGEATEIEQQRMFDAELEVENLKNFIMFEGTVKRFFKQY